MPELGEKPIRATDLDGHTDAYEVVAESDPDPLYAGKGTEHQLW